MDTVLHDPVNPIVYTFQKNLQIPSIAPEQIELTADNTPVWIRHSPFFDNIERTKIENLHQNRFLERATSCEPSGISSGLCSPIRSRGILENREIPVSAEQIRHSQNIQIPVLQRIKLSVSRFEQNLRSCRRL